MFAITKYLDADERQNDMHTQKETSDGGKSRDSTNKPFLQPLSVAINILRTKLYSYVINIQRIN